MSQVPRPSRVCAQCRRFLPKWDRHEKCARHRRCSQLAPCPLCTTWGAVQWGRVAQWLVSHPAPAPRKGKAKKVSSYKAPAGISGSSAGAVPVLDLPSPSQDLPGSGGNSDRVEIYASSLSGDSDCGHRNWLSGNGSPRDSASVRSLEARSGLTAETGSDPTAADQTLYAPGGEYAAGTGFGSAVSGQSADSPGCTPAGSGLDPRAGGSRTEGRVPSGGPSAQEPTDKRNPINAAAGHGPRPMAGSAGAPDPWSAGSRPGPSAGNPTEPAPRPARLGEDSVVLPIPLPQRAAARGRILALTVRFFRYPRPSPRIGEQA